MHSNNTQYNAIWLSDIHLGSKDCKAEFLLDMLNKIQCKKLYLVGDIVDIWALERRFHWPESHNQVIHTLLRKAKTDTKVIYVPGNHDEKVRKFVGMTFSDVEIHREYFHTTAAGKKMLITHGDDFDGEVCLGKWHSLIGDALYDLLLFLNRNCFKLRKKIGLNYWSLSGYIKTRVKGANAAIERYKHAAIKYAKSQQADGIICGHIHHPEMDEIDKVLYCNDGDWVENCTLIRENAQGELELIRWTSAVTQISTANVPIISEQAA